MPRTETKTSVNKIKKEKARKKSRQKKILVAIVLILVTAGAIGYLIYSNNQHGDAETYSDGGQTVRLLPDGTFNAILAHRVRKSGTYTKTTEGNRITVLFNINDREEIGRIIDDILYIPREWDDGHGHGNALRKVN
jgi:hypothetical protein